MKIAFRTDGGSGIGMGHIMRCLSLAREFRRSGHTVYFLSKVVGGREAIQQADFQLLTIAERDRNMSALEKELPDTIQLLHEYQIDLLIVDHYQVTKQYFTELDPHVSQLAYIDDLNRFTYPVDILINGNLTGDYLGYQQYTEEELMLLGPRYNLIREEFRNLPERVTPLKAKSLMLTTGGSDPFNLTVDWLKILLTDSFFQQIQIRVVIGGAFTNQKELYRLKELHPNLILHENVQSISKIMLASDLAISAGGSTLYELAACGTPAVGFIMVDNQEELVEKMAEMGYIENLGWYHLVQPTDLRETLKKLLLDQERRTELCQRGQKLVDALGTTRVVKEIEERFKM